MGNKKKLGLFACVATGVGAIIGSGIFGSLPTEINAIGSNVILAFIVATVFETSVMIPIMYAATIIPTSGGYYLMSAKLIHPWAGIGVFVDALIEPVWIALYAVLFTDYFCQLFPACSDNKIMVELALILVFGIVAYFGNYVFASANSIVVFALVLVVIMYIFFGVSGVTADDINVKLTLTEGIKFNSFAVAVNVFATCLTGASNLSLIANDIKNPRRNVPLAIIISTVLVSIIYILMSIVTLKYLGDNDIVILSDVAKSFMPSSMIVLFIVCGPILGILTTMSPVLMTQCSTLHAMAQDRLLPQKFTKTNKHGVAIYCLIYVILFSVICVLTGASIDVLIEVCSALNVLINIPICIFPFEIHKKYPHATRHPGFKINTKFVEIISAIVCVVSAYLAFTTLKSVGIGVWGIMLLYVLAILVYTIFRKKYLRSKGIDLMEELAEPLQSWEEHEEKCRQLDLNEK